MKNDRKTEILNAAIHIAKSQGFQKMTLQDVAKKAGCNHSLVLYYFGTSVKLRRAVMSEAIRLKDPAILAKGLATGAPKANRAPPELKEAAAKYLAGV